MKKDIRYFLYTIVILFVVSPTISLADTIPTSGQSGILPAVSEQKGFLPLSSNKTSLQNPLKVESIGGAVNLGVEVFTYIVIILAVLAFIWVGLQYILAQGNSDKITESSKWLGYIVMGVAIVLGARLMISIILATLEASGAVDKGVIQSAHNALQK